MDEKLVEKVSRAMAKADGKNPDDPAWIRLPGGESFGTVWFDKYASNARAAIQAMIDDGWVSSETANQWVSTALESSSHG